MSVTEVEETLSLHMFRMFPFGNVSLGNVFPTSKENRRQAIGTRPSISWPRNHRY